MTFDLSFLSRAMDLVRPVACAAVVLGATVGADAAPRSGASTATTTPRVNVPMTTTQSFNRSSARISPGMQARTDRVVAGLSKPGGARSMGLRSHAFANDGRGGTVQLPKATPGGQPITYQTTTLRPGSQKNTLSSGRVITGSTGSAYVTRHYEPRLTRRIR